ncbi:hypothetical protein ACFLWA_03815 [Chloroflexota bacterium]
MPQLQNLVPLLFLDGEDANAVATGNNAAWICQCGSTLPLVGRSGMASGVTDGYRVECLECHRRYFVVPDGGDRKRVLRVEQVPKAEAAGGASRPYGAPTWLRFHVAGV